MRKYITVISIFCFFSASAQSLKEEGWNPAYHASAAKTNDLVNTKLDIRFDFVKTWMYGKAWLTLHQHYYQSDSLNLDAKGMTIENISMVSGTKTIPLQYTYDNMNLHIRLNRVYHASENYTVYIQYISKPNEYHAMISTMMPGQKGLYFINPHNEIKGKPTQIWTQGETEANSYWVPTIDKPNQKTTDEITITVPAKYLTLSNGLLTSQKVNNDGTRSDTWKMDLPHAPYLLFMGVGEYAVIKDHYKNKEVSYYVEKEYAPFARRIFGNTPEMIALYSRLTGVDYPWPKYAQITGRDYIFGAMENTSATLHEESSQLDARELVDGNSWEDVISHELFHQWFGDYVTTESWSNITLNESFADYGETLWNEYKYGKDAGQATIYNDLNNYWNNPANANLKLVRFNYKNVVDAFDAVSYQKGGCILNMLRNYVGDSAFFRSLNLYLTTNKFRSGEVQNLRLAFEEVTGQDLNWYFNQWYYNSGHPKLNITYSYDAPGKTAKVYINQNQAGSVFKLPFAIDVYQGNEKKRYKVWMNNVADTFSFAANSKPDLINVDADKMLVCEKTDHKTAENFIFQYSHAGSYIDRREAIAFFLNNKNEPKSDEFLQTALKDKNDRLRSFVLQRLNMLNDTVRRTMETSLKELVKNDPKSLVRAGAIADLGFYKNQDFKPMFVKYVNDSSYTIAGNSLEALAKIDSVSALALAQSFSTRPAKGELLNAIVTLLSKEGDEKNFRYIYDQFLQAGINARFNLLPAMGDALAREKNADDLKKQVDVILAFRNDLPEFRGQNAWPQIDGVLNAIADAKKNAESPELATYIRSKIPAPLKQENVTEAPVVNNANVTMPQAGLQKYTGDYEYKGDNAPNGIIIKIYMKDQVMYMLVPGQPEYQLERVEENVFHLKNMEGFNVQFNLNNKGAVTNLLSIQPNGTFTAAKTK
ncbi:MAG: M1 family metallopeptidase [Chitinophagaceae bacterium]|nr:M1 family metallopeptidase [Chitinophagaceae bacterium]